MPRRPGTAVPFPRDHSQVMPMTVSSLRSTPAPAAGAPAIVDTSGAGKDLAVADDLLSLRRTTPPEPRPDEQLEALTLAVAADLPVLLWGEPGIGKTAALTQ